MAVNRKLNMQQDQRKAALRSLVTNLLWYGRIETTLARAKETRRIAEKLITLSVKEYANTQKATKKVAEFDNKGNKEIVKKEVVIDAPSKLAARRRIMQYVYNVPEPKKDGESKYDYAKRAGEVTHPLVEKMFREYGPKYYKRAQDLGQGGGYTRIIKKGPRRGDASEVVILELV
jgi:large subunit ribosomal protein L17